MTYTTDTTKGWRPSKKVEAIPLPSHIRFERLDSREPGEPVLGLIFGRDDNKLLGYTPKHGGNYVIETSGEFDDKYYFETECGITMCLFQDLKPGEFFIISHRRIEPTMSNSITKEDLNMVSGDGYVTKINKNFVQEFEFGIRDNSVVYKVVEL